MNVSTLDRSDVVHVLEREHAAARAQRVAGHARRPGDATTSPGRWGDFRDASIYRDAYLAINRHQGAQLYMLACASGARRIVEFGSSFGISTLYLAAAANDNDGQVTGTEYYANKREHALACLREAGLASRAGVLAGDATATLESIEGVVDFLFLDGDKRLYRRVLDQLLPQLDDGAWIVADNIDHFSGEHGDFRHFMTHSPQMFVSREIPVGKGMFSVSRFRRPPG